MKYSYSSATDNDNNSPCFLMSHSGCFVPTPFVLTDELNWLRDWAMTECHGHLMNGHLIMGSPVMGRGSRSEEGQVQREGRGQRGG